MTREFLGLESEIDVFASQTEEGAQFASGRFEQIGLHAGFEDQLDRIVAEAAHLREEAAAAMEKASAIIAETES
ncbi:MAG: hypothetical protein QOC72_2350 [Methylobacteriaceae bacterium]|nr:hypothetical protein [Methylobacteriaceae bacterium]